MKKMFVPVTVFAILLNLSFDFVDCKPPVEEFVSYEHFSASLSWGRFTLMNGILDKWLKCKTPLELASNFSLNLFQNFNDVETIRQKRMMDCTMREMRVITDDGFQEEEYLIQVRKLLFTYIPFDMKKQSDVVKQQVQLAIDVQQVKQFYQNESCYPIGDRLLIATESDKSDVPIMFKVIPSNLVPGLCHELMDSYEMAAHACKDQKDPNGDSAITAWMIVECINKAHNGRQFYGPFYPGILPEAFSTEMEHRDMGLGN